MDSSKLTALERLAITRTFADPSGYVLSELHNACIIERDHTGCGVYVTLRFPDAILEGAIPPWNTWTFTHERLLVEGVTFDDPWPVDLDLDGLQLTTR